jgi:hypothetical protein
VHHIDSSDVLALDEEHAIKFTESV